MRELKLKLDKRKRPSQANPPPMSRPAPVKPSVTTSVPPPPPPEELKPTSPWREDPSDGDDDDDDDDDDFRTSPIKLIKNQHPEWVDTDDQSDCSSDRSCELSDDSEDNLQQSDDSDDQSLDDSSHTSDDSGSDDSGSDDSSDERNDGRVWRIVATVRSPTECRAEPNHDGNDDADEVDAGLPQNESCTDRAPYAPIPQAQEGNGDVVDPIVGLPQHESCTVRAPYAPVTSPVSSDDEVAHPIPSSIDHMSTNNPQTPDANSTKSSAPYTCPFCEKVFGRIWALQRHIRTIHQPTDNHHCPSCNKKFKRADNLARHTKTCTGGHKRRNTKPLSHAPKRQRIHYPQNPINSPQNPINSPQNPINSPQNPIIISDSDISDNENFQHGNQQIASVGPDVIHTGEPDVDRVIDENWGGIKSCSSTGKVQDRHNLVLDSEPLRPRLQTIYQGFEISAKCNASYGYILRNVETGEIRYFHPSMNNSRLLEIPMLIRNGADFTKFVDEITHADVLEWARQQRPNTKWVVVKVTNLTVYVNKIRGHPIGAPVTLPQFIVNNQGLVSLTKNTKTGKPYTDNLCLFRCLCLHYGKGPRNLETLATALFQRYSNHTKERFKGVPLDELFEVEKEFQIKIEVYSLEMETDEDGLETGNTVARLVRRSPTEHQETMRVNLHNDHFSYIADLDRYSHSFPCEHCGRIWRHSHSMLRHEPTCRAGVSHRFPGGMYSTSPTVFERLEDEGINIPEDLRYYPFRATYDWESYFAPANITSTTKLEWESEHVPLSVSVSSNVPGFDTPECFISEGNTYELVEKMVEQLNKISEKSKSIITERLAPYIKQITTNITNLTVHNQLSQAEVEKLPLSDLLTRLEYYIAQMPVIGFNSGRYDLNLVKPALMKILDGSLQYVIKHTNNIMCISTTTLRFLDMVNYLSPNCSYANYLKAYGCSVEKGYFPYEWMTSLAQLDHPNLPPHIAFYSALKQSNITTEEYAYCQDVWAKNNMTSFRQFVVWYNNLDVTGFLEAIEKQCVFYKSIGIDMFKDGISVPGLTLKYLFNTLDAGQAFSLINSANEDLHYTIKDNIVGGPSIIFHRYHEKAITKIKEMEYGPAAKMCEGVVGYDANALYLYALMQDQATGIYVRRKAEDEFKPKKSQTHGFKACQWLDWMSSQTGYKIRHQFNGGEKRIGHRRLPVDGFCKETKTAYEFLGCYFHAHSCVPDDVTRATSRTVEEIRSSTEKKLQYVKDAGYNLVSIRECEWDELIKGDTDLKEFLKKTTPRRAVLNTKDKILNGIRDDKWFGLVECDVEVPENLKEHFAEFPPIFKNCDVGKEDIGPVMRDYAEENDIMRKPRKMLISSFVGKKVLIGTPLAKWYLDHGLIISHIYQIIEYERQPCFKAFGDAVSDARREGDSCKDKAIIADTKKLIGNCGYGKTATNKEKHRDVVYCTDINVDKHINNKLFRKLNVLSGDFYEVEKSKQTITFDLPIQIGFMVYQYAKLRMLEFVFDFIDVYLDRKDYQICETDTDSLYIAISGSCIEDVIKPGKKADFYKARDKFLVAESCPTHRSDYVAAKLNNEAWEMAECCAKTAAYETRTPGLFKKEWEGDAMVCLNSKTYYCVGPKDKYSTKGLNKRQNEVTKQQFLDVISTKQSRGGVNRGFRVRENTMYTYSQQKDALTYFYPKRIVLNDGVTTVPLSI